MLRLCFSVALWCSCVEAATVPIATFDGSQATTRAWETTNDPVMGGQSESSFTVDAARKVGVWIGEVKIVPFLESPGFCNLQSPGLYPDLSSMDGMVVRAREANSEGLLQYNVMLMSEGAKHGWQSGVYEANFSITNKMEDHFVPWSAFECSWRGQKVSWCPELNSQLKEINSVGLGTSGTPGPFNVEIESVSAVPAPMVVLALDSLNHIDLATFDGKAPHKWHSENDPVMGGQSSSSIAVAGGYADYKGSTRIVPSLNAPGFTIALTEGAPFFSKFPDASSMDGLTVSVRNLGNFTGYKIAFCDSRINFYRCQFQSFKADLPVPANADFQDVFVPWASFSDKWDAATGKHTAESPPTKTNLQAISQLQFWTEAVEGDFHLQFQYVRASKASQALI